MKLGPHKVRVFVFVMLPKRPVYSVFVMPPKRPGSILGLVTIPEKKAGGLNKFLVKRL